MNTDQLIQTVNAALLELHRSRVARQGADGAGLFSHYAALLDEGMLFRAEEIEAFRLVQEVLPAYGEYVVLRAGLGELAFLLNGAGRRVAACEPNAARFQALEAGLAQLVGARIVDGRRFRIAADFVAERSKARPVLGVATDFVSGLALEDDDEFCRRLRQLDGLLINPRLFIRLRETPSERRAVAAFLHSLGFTDVRAFDRMEMAYFVRPATKQALPAADVDARTGGQPAPDFDDVVRRLVSLAPALPPARAGTTWVGRRGRKVDLRSALGDDE